MGFDVPSMIVVVGGGPVVGVDVVDVNLAFVMVLVGGTVVVPGTVVVTTGSSSTATQ